MKNQIKKIVLSLFIILTIQLYSFPLWPPYLNKIEAVNCTNIKITYEDLIANDTVWLDVSLDSNFSTFVIKKLIIKTSLWNQGDDDTTTLVTGLTPNILYYFRLGSNYSRYNYHLFNWNKTKFTIKYINPNHLNNLVLRDSFVSCDSFIAVWTKIPNATYNVRLYRRDSTPLIVYTNLQSKMGLFSNFCTFKGLQSGKSYYWDVEVIGCIPNNNTGSYLSNKKKTSLGGGKPYAGIDMHNFQANAVLLNANPILFPNIGTWSVIEGDGGIITNINDPKSIFTGTIGVRYKLKWQSTFPGCDDSDTVEISLMCGYPITDTRDSQVYPTVYLKGFCWLAKNLNYGQFLNSSTNQNSGGTVFKYCYDDSIINCNKYGGLYQWDNLMRGASMYNQVQGICPTGWHVATHIEWDSISNFTNGYKNFQLQEGGSTKFESKYGGIFVKYIGFQGKNNSVYYYNSGYWYNYMFSYNQYLYPGRYNGIVLNAFALRCVMD